MSRSLEVISRRLAPSPPLFHGRGRARACAHTRRARNKRRQSARQDNVLERLGAGGASVLQHAAAIFPPIRAA